MRSVNLTILCVSAGDEYGIPFIDEMEALAGNLGAAFVLYDGSCAGCVEHVLDDAVAECADGYVLRLDDDERCSPGMVDWLHARRYETARHWCFPRAHLYPHVGSYITSPPLWPDLQTRLSTNRLAGSRRRVHAPSPHGTGQHAPVAIEHHKFIVRPEHERLALLDKYEQLQPGAGAGWRVFSHPESFQLDTAPYEPSAVAA